MAHQPDPQSAATVPSPPVVASTLRGPGGRPVRDLTTGSITKSLFALASPMAAGYLVNSLDQVIDLIWVGRLGVASVASVGSAMVLVSVVMTLRMGLTTGARALIARAYGAGDLPLANRVLQQEVMLAGVSAIGFALIGVAFTEPLMRLMGLKEEVVQTGANYLRVAFLSSVTMAFLFVGTSALQSAGDAVTPMWVTFIQRVAHAVVDPFLIFGWAFFPRLEVAGAAWANLATQGLAALVVMALLVRGRSGLRLQFRGMRPDKEIMWSILKIALPASITGAERTFAQMVMLRIVASFGTTAVAAMAIAQRADMFLLMPVWGLAMGAGVMVGQNLGAEKPQRANLSNWYATAYVTAVIALAAVAFFLFPQYIARIFSPDPQLVEMTARFLRIAAVGMIFMGPATVIMTTLQGAGETIGPMFINFVGLWVFEIPLALVLPGFWGLGVYGTRWAVVAHMLVRGLVYMGWWQMGRWRRIEVMPQARGPGMGLGMGGGPGMGMGGH